MGDLKALFLADAETSGLDVVEKPEWCKRSHPCKGLCCDVRAEVCAGAVWEDEIEDFTMMLCIRGMDEEVYSVRGSENMFMGVIATVAKANSEINSLCERLSDAWKRE